MSVLVPQIIVPPLSLKHTVQVLSNLSTNPSKKSYSWMQSNGGKSQLQAGEVKNTIIPPPPQFDSIVVLKVALNGHGQDGQKSAWTPLGTSV